MAVEEQRPGADGASERGNPATNSLEQTPKSSGNAPKADSPEVAVCINIGELATSPPDPCKKRRSKLSTSSSKDEDGQRSASSSPKKKKSLTEDSGVVIGNFHAFETDDQTEVLVPRLVNGCSRVLPPPKPPQCNGSRNGTHAEFVSFRKSQRDDEEETKCGIGGTCGCCQHLASRQTFMVIFCLTTVLQGMFYTYFASGLSTIQKLYRISSQVTGIVMSATEVGQIGGSLFLAYYGGNGHRPRWIAWGMVLFSMCTFLCAVPHFIFSFTETNPFPHSVNSGDEMLEDFNVCNVTGPVTLSYAWENGTNSSFEFQNNTSNACEDPSRLTNFVLGLFFLALIGVGIGQTAVVNLGIPYIDDNVDNKDSPMYFATTSAVRILGPTFGFMLGSVCTRLYVFPMQDPGFPTSDPRWVGAWWLGHIIVSALLLVASFVMFLFPRRLPGHPRQCLASPTCDDGHPTFPASITVTSIVSGIATRSPEEAKVRTNITALFHPASTSPSRQPSALNLPLNDVDHCEGQVPNDGDTAGPEDPMLRPRVDGGNRNDRPCLQERVEMQLMEQHEAAEVEYWSSYRREPTIKDFPRAVRRQLRNPVLVLRTASSVLHILPIAGLYTFLPKYLETQFRLPVPTAAMLAGTGGILLMGVGILISGIYIRHRRPSARAITAWIAVTALLYSVGMVILMFVGCEQDDIAGMVLKDGSSTPVFEPLCNRSCAGSCDDSLYAPVCTRDGKTHFSACHLGCSAVVKVNDSSAVGFSECECVAADMTAELRLCDLECNSVVWYIVIFAVFVIIHSTAEVGGMLITLRCCQKQDKAMALGLISLAIGLFGNMPCPIIYGGIVDAACIQWRSTCGTFGDCQLYDTRFFRLVFHGITAAVMLLAFFVDVAVWMKSKHIILQPDTVEDDQIFWDGHPTEVTSSPDTQPEAKHSKAHLPPSDMTPSTAISQVPRRSSSPGPESSTVCPPPLSIVPETSLPLSPIEHPSPDASAKDTLDSQKSRNPRISSPLVRKSRSRADTPTSSPQRRPVTRATRPSKSSPAPTSPLPNSPPNLDGSHKTPSKYPSASRMPGTSENSRPEKKKSQVRQSGPSPRNRVKVDTKRLSAPTSAQKRTVPGTDNKEDEQNANKGYRSTAL